MSDLRTQVMAHLAAGWLFILFVGTISAAWYDLHFYIAGIVAQMSILGFWLVFGSTSIGIRWIFAAIALPYLDFMLPDNPFQSGIDGRVVLVIIFGAFSALIALLGLRCLMGNIARYWKVSLWELVVGVPGFVAAGGLLLRRVWDSAPWESSLGIATWGGNAYLDLLGIYSITSIATAAGLTVLALRGWNQVPVIGLAAFLWIAIPALHPVGFYLRHGGLDPTDGMLALANGLWIFSCLYCADYLFSLDGRTFIHVYSKPCEDANDPASSDKPHDHG